MTTYRTIDYVSDLTVDQISAATKLTFTQFMPPLNGVGDMLDWDFEAFFATSVVTNDSARNIFAFEGTAGATYDIYSRSFFDPFVLQLFDDQGKVIATDDFSGANGIDHIEYRAPYDGTFYVDASWHQGFTDADKYASITVYEDLDTIPPLFTASSPAVATFSPTNSAIGVPVDSNIVLTFNEAIQRGTSSILLKTAANILVESFSSASSNNLSISGETLTINPTNNLSGSTQYFVTLSPGSVEDLAGNSNVEINSYSFTTIALLPSAIDRIFNWGENHYSNLFSGHQESLDILGYYARMYANGNAIGAQNDNIYYYDGGTDGTGNITLVGTIADFLPYAISAGF